MIPSHAIERAITISIYEPLIKHNGSERYIGVIDSEIESYSHTIAADGGFLSCEITLKTNETEADDWIINGIGRHISVKGTGGENVWEGFVDNISVDMGNISIERGRLSEICNRCMVTYTPITGYDPETSEPLTGDQTQTLIAESPESYNKHGHWEEVVSGGTLDEDSDADNPRLEATYLRDAYLEDHQWVEVSHRPNLGVQGDSEIKISLDCKGYYEWLNAYVYEYGDEEYTTDVTTKISDVLSADTNNIFSTDLSGIEYNGVLISSYEATNRTAMTVITEAVSLGDIYNNRWIFGIYDNRRATYKAIPDAVEYIHYVGDSSQKILDASLNVVPSWSVRPGKFVRMPDLLIGRLPDYEGYGLRYDRHVMFVERVVYTAPDKVELQGKKVMNVTQYLAKLGV